MSNGDLKNLAADLKQRREELDRRLEELDRRGKATAETNPTPTTPNPSSYVTSIKTYVPITLDLTESNYAKWRELFLIALGRYSLTSHVLAMDDTSPSDTLPSSK
jgi:hypothetical protein